MCHEYYRRRREADESQAIWPEFDQAPPVDGPVSPADMTEPEPAELREAIATPER